MDTLGQLRTSINNGLAKEEAINLLNEYIVLYPASDEAYTLRGLQYWSLGNRSAAINDYLKALKLNPQSKAKEALRSANEILNYYNKDLYNP